jgi:flagellar biosynthesis chaperone FliJ
MDKELQLIYEYKNAPAELKAAADAHRTNSSALAKKQAQIKALQVEIEKLNKEYEKTEKAFRVALKAWTPVGA